MLLRRIFLLFSLGLGVLGTYCRALTDAAPEGMTKGEVSSWYENTLKKEESDLRTELFTLIKIENQNEWQEIKKDWKPEYANLSDGWGELKQPKITPFSKKLSAPIIELLGNQKIRKMLDIVKVEKDQEDMLITATRQDGQTITFCCDKKLGADAATNQFNVFINPDALLETHANPAEIKATIAHELIHIAHEDPLDVFCMEVAYMFRKKKTKKYRKKYQTAKGKWERFQEKRADILSALIGMEYAQAHEDHFIRNMPQKESLSLTSTHPTDHQRCEYISKLVKDMKQARPDFNYILLLIVFLLIFAVLGAKLKNRKRH